jgi:hypothetical protein
MFGYEIGIRALCPSGTCALHIVWSKGFFQNSASDGGINLCSKRSHIDSIELYSPHPARRRYAPASDPPPPGEGELWHGCAQTIPAFRSAPCRLPRRLRHLQPWLIMHLHRICRLRRSFPPDNPSQVLTVGSSQAPRRRIASRDHSCGRPPAG